LEKLATWKVEGDYFEACNCDSICPCVFLADPDQDDCKLTIGWHINKGHHGSTSLDGLNVVGIFHAIGNMVKGSKWRAAIYLDERANEVQSTALSKIFSGQVGGFPATVATFIGEMLGVKTTKIQFVADGKKRHLVIPNILELEAESVTGSNPDQESKVTNPALYAAPGFDPVIARSTKYTYRDYNLVWDNSGKNSFHSKFNYAP
jgi:hypothetical protein